MNRTFSALRHLLLRSFASSIREELVRTAARAPQLLGKESTELVRRFLAGQQNADGGFQNRAGKSDLYYTVFGLQAQAALFPNNSPPLSAPLQNWLSSFGDGGELDFVHLCCLARCRALAKMSHGSEHVSLNTRMRDHLETFRANDGGYSLTPDASTGSAYAGFLACGAYEDLHLHLPEPEALAAAIQELGSPEGDWGGVNATGAALTALWKTSRSLNSFEATRRAARWLIAQAHPLGGFRAAPQAPLPDLLSTATALSTLGSLTAARLLDDPLKPLRDLCLDFLDSLWNNRGGFHGHWGDDTLDVEFTFYGLLALGALV